MSITLFFFGVGDYRPIIIDFNTDLILDLDFISLYTLSTYSGDKTFEKYFNEIEEISNNRGRVLEIRGDQDNNPWDLSAIHE